MILRDLGHLAYAAGLSAQRQARARVAAGGEDELLIVEHDPVVTLGRRGGAVDRARLARLNTPVVQTRRGGLATWHGPGQLVAYPIIDLRRVRLSVPAFVRRLGALMVDTCAHLGLTDVAYDDARPGVYRAGRKLGSVGLHIHRQITLHGLSLNICNDLAGFSAITPCGLDGLVVTTVARELGAPVSLDEARRRLVVAAAERLGEVSAVSRQARPPRGSRSPRTTR